jgi:hypothetical protein
MRHGTATQGIAATTNFGHISDDVAIREKLS